MIQDKYKNAGNFEEILNVSQCLVNEIGDILKDNGFIVRKYHDSEPFYIGNNSEMRGLDLLIAHNGRSAFIDAKDFGKFKYYLATGLPVSLIEKYRMIKRMFGIDCYLFFKDNESVEDPHPSSFKKDGVFIPYGGEIDLLKEHPLLSKKDKYRCRWKGQYLNELQEIWEVNKMNTIYDIINDWNKLF